MELGSIADDLFYRLLDEYPEYLSVYGKTIEDEMKGKFGGIDIPESSPEELRLAGKICVVESMRSMGKTQYK